MCGGVAPELNQARLVRVQFQPELAQALLPLQEEPLRVGAMFESRDNVIRVPDHDCVAGGVMLAPVPDPQVEDLMQVDVRQQWRDHCPLRCPYFRLRPFPVLGDPGPQPFPDEAQDSPVSDAMLEELAQPFV